MISTDAFITKIINSFLLVVCFSMGTTTALARTYNLSIKKQNLRPVIGVFSQQTNTITTSNTIDPKVKAKL